MASSYLLSIITFIYGLSALLYVISWIFSKELPGKIATWVTLAGAIGNASGIIIRWIESYESSSGYAPFTNTYEVLIFFSLTIAILYLIIEKKYKNRILGAFTLPIVFISIAYSSLPVLSDQIQPHVSESISQQLDSLIVVDYHIRPLMPALKSNWLIAHVITCFLGYSGFAIAFGLSIMYLLRETRKNGETRLISLFPPQNILDEMTHQMVMFGFFFLSIGIITGSVWGNVAWGRYWGWDNKETWSLITWLIYAAMLHFKMVRGWSGIRIAIFSIIGFIAVFITWIGVNYFEIFRSNLHSYG